MYKCPYCGFEIETEPAWHNNSFFGDVAQVTCLACGEVNLVKFGADILVGEKTCLSLNEALSMAVCKNCGTKGMFKTWRPDDGCPKCGKKLLRNPVPTAFRD